MEPTNNRKSRKRWLQNLSISSTSFHKSTYNQNEDTTDEEEIVSQVNIEDYFNACVSEIASLADGAATHSSLPIVSNLPPYMRRRAASHNSKRLPRSIRMRIGTQSNKDNDNKVSRRKRRKPSNLNDAYLRRQANVMWLDTHIWHAKRFRMCLKWGYRIPLTPNNKGVRTFYRAISNRCLLVDTSYISHYQLSGSLNQVRDYLSFYLSKEDLCKLFSDNFMSGHSWENATLKEGNQILGPLDFMWCSASTCTFVKLILAIHPSIKITWKPSELVVIKKLPLSRFRLLGEQALKVISGALKAPNFENMMTSQNPKFWYQLFTRDPVFASSFNEQLNTCSKLSTLSCEEKSLIPFIARDPRMTLPKKIEKISEKQTSMDLDSFQSTSASLLWSENFLLKSKIEMTKTAKINELRGAKLRNDETLPFSTDEDIIAAMLLRIPGGRMQCSKKYPNSEFIGSGFDILIPSVWARPLWISFIYQGAYPGGLDQLSRWSLECSKPCFPLNGWPDTRAEEEDILETSKNMIRIHKALPPSKRCNYAKLSIANPFESPWTRLVQEWGSPGELPVQVQRSKTFCLSLEALVTNDEFNEDKYESLLLRHEAAPYHLVFIRLDLKKSVAKFPSILCLPTGTDLSQLDDEGFSGPMQQRSSSLSSKKENGTRFRNSCDRDIIGFVLNGCQSEFTGHGVANAFITVASLKEIWRNRSISKTNLCLFRNTNSYHYFFANISILK